MSVISMFACIAESIPGAGLFGVGTRTDEMNEAPDLSKSGVLLYEVLGYSASGNIHQLGRYEQRFYFVIPGRIISSSVSFERPELALEDAKDESWRGVDGGHSLDITPTLIVEMINPKVFRIRNADSMIPSVVQLNQDDQDGAEAAPKDGIFMNLHFQSEETATLWAETLMRERQHIYFPTLLGRDSEFCSAFHSALWRGIVEKRKGFNEIRSVYYSCERGGNGPEQVFIAVYNIMSSIASKGQMSSSLFVEAYLEVLAVLVVSVPARIFFLSWTLNKEFLLAFENYYQRLVADSKAKDSDSEQNIAASAESTLGGFMKLVNSLAGGSASLSPLTLVALAKHIEQKTSDPYYSVNAATISKIYGYPSACSPSMIESPEHASWLSMLHSGKGKVTHPVVLSVSQAMLLLEPGPYCGYFFIDYAIETDDVKRARATCQCLPYDMTKRFAAIHVNAGTEDGDFAAHFVAYLEWDSLQRGYEEFLLKNKNNGRVEALIKDARALYTTPICTASHLELSKMARAEVMQDFITQLLDGADEEDCKQIQVVRKVLGHWMSASKKIGPVEVPRKAHVITLLLLSFWLLNRNSIMEGGPTSPLLKTPQRPANSAPLSAKAIIGSVVQDEDRALILAISATDVVMTHGKAVHVLYATAEDLFRDYTRVLPYFNALGLSTSMNDFSASAQIIYCLQKDLLQFYRETSFTGKDPLTRTVLFIHDVATFSAGTSLNSIYGKKNEGLSPPFKEYLDVLAALPATEALNLEAPMPPFASAHSDELALRATAWDKAKRAWSDFSEMLPNKPLGYVKQGNTLVHLDANGKPQPHKYSLGIECARYKLLSIEPSINSKFFFQSLPHMLSQYDCIFGLESPVAHQVSEGIEFLSQYLGAWSFNIPNDEAQKNFATLLTERCEEADDEVRSDEELAAERAEAADNALTPGKVTDKNKPEAMFSPVTDKAASVMSVASKGQMMGELCDRFYKKYPHSPENLAAWPTTSEHRKLIQFLEDDRLHDIDGVRNFAVTLKLQKIGSYGFPV